jgi:hypothetical protein
LKNKEKIGIRDADNSILSQARLPIPPQGQAARIIAANPAGSTPVRRLPTPDKLAAST